MKEEKEKDETGELVRDRLSLVFSQGKCCEPSSRQLLSDTVPNPTQFFICGVVTHSSGPPVI